MAPKKTNKKTSTKSTKATAKPAAKKATAKSQKVEKSEPKAKTVKTKRSYTKYIITAAVVGIVVLGLIFLKNQIFVATVNGRPITRWELVNELEKQGGSFVLENMIVLELIDQEAYKAGIVITQQEIDEEIEKQKETLGEGVELETALAAQGRSMDDLVKEIVINKKLERLVADKLEVTDEEVNEYYTTEKEYYDEQEITEEEAKAQIRESVKQQKLQFEVSSYIQELKQKAVVNYYLQKVKPAEQVPAY